MDHPTRPLDPSAPPAPPDPRTQRLQQPTADSVCAKCAGPLKKVALQQEPRALTSLDEPAIWWRGRNHSPLAAWVCTHCGYLELYAEQPEGL